MVRQGYLIWVDFDPQIGYEQKGRRPALVISNETFNNFSKMAIVCPITNTDKTIRSCKVMCNWLKICMKNHTLKHLIYN